MSQADSDRTPSYPADAERPRVGLSVLLNTDQGQELALVLRAHGGYRADLVVFQAEPFHITRFANVPYSEKATPRTWSLPKS